MPPYTTTHSTSHANIQTHTTSHSNAHASPNPSPQCLTYALFMHSLPAGWALFLALIFAILAAASTQAVRRWTPGVVSLDNGEMEKAKEGEQAETVEGSQTRDRTGVEAGSGGDGNLTRRDESEVPLMAVDGDVPPPYEGPALTTTSTPGSQIPSSSTSVQHTAIPEQTASGSMSTLKSKPHSKIPQTTYTSAHLFVIGSSLFVLAITLLALSALSIQAASLCDSDGQFSTLARVVLWLLFAIPAGWSTTALSCWLILLRNLWAPKSWVRKLEIHEGTVALGVLVVLFVPFTMAAYVLGGAAVWAVQWCQRVCCGVVGEDELEQEDVELERGGGSGRSGIGSMGSESQELNDVEEEERVALMGDGIEHGSGKGSV